MAERKAYKKEKSLEQAGSGKIRFSLSGESGFGMNEVLGIAAALIIAGLVIIPGLMDFARNILLEMDSWWSDIATEIFHT
jgi:hypothetical protein